MPRLTINVPMNDDTMAKAEGNAVLFSVAGKRVRFIIQDKRNGEEIDSSLVHAASGGTVISSNTIKAIKLSNFRSGNSMTDRAAATEAFRKLIRRVGSEKVITVIRAGVVVNPIGKGASL